MEGIHDYKDLLVWQKSRQLVREVYTLTRCLPKEELYALTSQIRRAAISIPSNIAEGYGRNYLPEYVRFLRIAKGSCFELETQVILCCDLEFLSTEQAEHLIFLIRETERLLIGLLKSLGEK